jgi:hypothetical protein
MTVKHLILAAALILAACFALEGIRGKPGKPEVFMISLQKQRDFERRDVWYLEYALDGRIEQAVFYDAGTARDYIDYLKGMGKITGGGE